MQFSVIFCLLFTTTVLNVAHCRPNKDIGRPVLPPTGTAQSDSAAAVEVGPVIPPPPPVDGIPQIQIFSPPSVNPQITVVHTQPQPQPISPPTGFSPVQNPQLQPVGVGISTFGRRPVGGGGSASASSSSSSSATSNGLGGDAIANSASAANANVRGNGNASASSSSSAIAVGK